jgi:hypothetical protein
MTGLGRGVHVVGESVRSPYSIEARRTSAQLSVLDASAGIMAKDQERLRPLQLSEAVRSGERTSALREGQS